MPLIAVLLLLTSTISAIADTNECLPLDKHVTISGYPARITVPGPPEYRDVADGDQAGKIYAIFHNPGVCVQGYEGKTQLIQTTCAFKYKEGSPVTLKGTLYESHAGHHWTPILLDCTN